MDEAWMEALRALGLQNCAYKMCIRESRHEKTE